MTSSLLLLLTTIILLDLLSTSTAFAYPPPLRNNPWLPFKNLTGCHNGVNRTGLSDLKSYLHHFGYLPSSNFTDHFDDTLEAAIRTYQHNLGLDNTGILDDSTINELMSPRCGVADVYNSTTSLRGRNLYTYFPGTPTWPLGQRKLKYAITATSAVNFDIDVLKSVFASAFSRWSAVTNVNFTETDNSDDADITIGFYLGSHGDGEPFDGVLGTLAHSFSPTDGRFHLDAAETWVVDGDVTESSSDTAIDLESVAVHEIGHLLGLGHTSVQEAIMYPTIRTRTKKVELASDDVDGVQSLYGSNPTYRAPAPGTVTGSIEERNGAVGVGVWSLWSAGMLVLLSIVELL